MYMKLFWFFMTISGLQIVFAGEYALRNGNFAITQTGGTTVFITTILSGGVGIVALWLATRVQRQIQELS
jgi:hypothetical protein